MFENENHQRAHDFLMQGNFRKAHTLLAQQMNPEMGGLIWVDFLYLQTIVHPNQFNVQQLEEVAKVKPEWDFLNELIAFLSNNDLEMATKHIYEQFEIQNTIRKNVMESNISTEDIQRIIDFKNRPI